MAKINDPSVYPLTTPSSEDKVIGTDISNTSNSANGETVSFGLGDITKLVPVVIVVSLTGETEEASTGTAKNTFRSPYGFIMTNARLSASVAPVGANMVVDINVNGNTILATKLSIDDGEKTSTTASVEVSISSAPIADDSEITVDIDQVGSTTAGSGVKLYMIGYRT